MAADAVKGCVHLQAQRVKGVIMPGSVIRRGAVVRRSILAENATVSAGAIVGEKEGNIAVVGQGVNVPAGASVSAGQQVDENTEF